MDAIQSVGSEMSGAAKTVPREGPVSKVRGCYWLNTGDNHDEPAVMVYVIVGFSNEELPCLVEKEDDAVCALPEPRRVVLDLSVISDRGTLTEAVETFCAHVNDQGPARFAIVGYPPQEKDFDSRNLGHSLGRFYVASGRDKDRVPKTIKRALSDIRNAEPNWLD